MDRRRFIRKAAALAATIPPISLLGGCAELIDAIVRSCPDDASETGDINWVPNVLHPVFYGYHDLTTADGAPGALRVWYPTYEGFLPDPPILKMCVVRWPLVLFLHGMPPPSRGPRCDIPNYNQLWDAIPAMLARSGYVVLVPQYSAFLPVNPLSPTDWPLTLLDWARSGWQHARWVDPRAEATAVAGHSYGALLAARVAAARPAISAFVGLGGVWSELGTPAPLLGSLDAPSLFMYTSDGSETLDTGGLWPAISAPKYGARYDGQHFDYLSDVFDCPEARGECTFFERAAADLIALFLGRFLPVPLALPHIPQNLDPPPVSQTMRQAFFSGGHLTGDGRLAGLDAFSGRTCRIDLRWEEGGTTGERTIGG